MESQADRMRIDHHEFARMVQPFHRELLAHCRRMLGSLDDAEDQLQETYLRAWQSYAGFEGKSSLRTWLYRIATNVCRTALERGRRLPVPSGFADSRPDEGDGPNAWPSPFEAGRLAPDEVTDPAEIISSREHSRDALAHAWRRLTPRQRSVLILRDVLGMPAIEVADLLGTTDAAVHSTVRRGRTLLTRERPAPAGKGGGDAPHSALLDEYASAFETGDIAALKRLLTKDAAARLPAGIVSGRDALLDLLVHCPGFGDSRKLPITVNGHRGFGVYRANGDDVYRAYAIDFLTVARTGIHRMEMVEDRAFFPAFGLPLVLPPA
ncbi:RNA polymerase sigma-70 factor (ECF subfamily) [Herbihabitans rhizosphaerae]|uniref:RNA polymerase sigma-70 factor (ECF subfamily) n=1 Tax=Herbihabitans rhizosphaerae TaxID=1872711 RepID=A0A4Q7KZ11_9PSEU|nr:RNA polymerase subunit sigma-70 [Herbihabitans rhizosphaerae]RZS40922.1 RNA polymerase sigma-70 factor (ECF subfamily) [Herbihabitans rhizosphaerae]